MRHWYQTIVLLATVVQNADLLMKSYFFIIYSTYNYSGHCVIRNDNSTNTQIFAVLLSANMLVMGIHASNTSNGSSVVKMIFTGILLKIALSAWF